LDIAGINSNSGGGFSQCGTLLGNGDGTLGPFITIPGDCGSSLPHISGLVAEMNGDGKPDLVVAQQDTGGTYVLPNTTMPAPGTSFAPSTVSFPSQTVETSSGPVALTLTNSGGSTLIVTTVAISGGNASEFSQTNNCTSVQPMQTCVINVTFSPSTTGSAAASLTVTDNGTGSPQLVAILGIAVAESAIGISVPAGSGSATVTAGSTAKYLLSIGRAGWSGTATLKCAGVPADAVCTVPSIRDGQRNFSIDGRSECDHNSSHHISADSGESRAMGSAVRDRCSGARGAASAQEETWAHGQNGALLAAAGGHSHASGMRRQWRWLRIEFERYACGNVSADYHGDSYRSAHANGDPCR